MKRFVSSLLVCGLTLALCMSVFAGPIELRLKDGTRWRGQVSDVVKLTILESGKQTTFEGTIVSDADLYLTVEGMLLGKATKRTIFKSDIVAVTTVADGKPAAAPAAPSKPSESPDTAAPPKPAAESPARETGDDGTTASSRADEPDPASKSARGKKQEILKSPKPGVFVLPLGGMVGLEFRHEEMQKIAREADKYGPGQIIVLIIDSGGGLVSELEDIHKTLVEIKKRHRLVAWIKKAISAACATAIHCDEIYFMTEGTAGSMTAFAGDQSWQGEELQHWLNAAGDWAASGGRSPYIAQAMIHAALLLSYDKNPETGEVTWHNDLSGQYILSREDENLCFNSSNAVHCGFADGIADTEADLAKQLNLPEWYEISRAGRDMSASWTAVVEKANDELPKLFARYSYKGAGLGDPEARMGIRINLLKQLVDWWERCPNACRLKGVPPKRVLEQEITELKKTLADMKKSKSAR